MTDERKQEIYEMVMRGTLEQDVVVLENMHIMPCMDVEYHSQYFYIGMCSSGCTIGSYDYHNTVFQAGDICWILPDHVLSHNYVSDDYSVLSVFITPSFFKRLKQMGVLGKYHYLANISCMHLPHDVFDIMYNSFRLLGMLTGDGIPNREELIPSLIQILSTVCDDYILKQMPDIPKRQKQHEQLFEQFYDAVIEHYRESREVTFYADLFCLSPKYFSSVIKKTTGIAAIEWINRYVIIKAKWMLLHERQKSIQQIAGDLGFSEQSSFSRLFKQYEGITPTAFRERY